MLLHLKIKNFALIDEVEVNFQKGFTTITGQTGAGKSIVLKAIELVLGARADLNLIKNQEKKSVIEAAFEVADHHKELFEELDLDFWNESILRREINSSGKSRMFVNDTPVNLSALKVLGAELLQIHTQHQTYEIKKNNFSLNLIDRYGELQNDLKSYQKSYRLLNSLRKEFDQLKQEIDEANKEQSYLEFQLEEIEQLNLEEDFESLQKSFDRMENSQELIQGVNEIQQLLNSDQDSIVNLLSQAQRKIEDLTKLDPSLEDLSKRLNSIQIEAQDIYEELDDVLPNGELDEEDRLVVEDKLNLYNSLLRKHFLMNQNDLIQLKEDLGGKLELISVSDSKLSALQDRIAQIESECLDLAHQLSKKRKSIAEGLAKNIEAGLSDMSMADADITFRIEERTSLGPYGLDDIDCLIAVNKGMTPGLIEKSISGGEMSRFMLATQNIIASKAALPTMIFDEIDTGVSGNVAEQMADKMKEMSKSLQVMSITHLPQVAAKGDNQLTVTKQTEGDRTVSMIKELSSSERVEEIAKLISGKDISNEAKLHAEQLLNQN